MVVTNRNSPN